MQFKINETVTWHAPSSHVGHLAFWATIVQEDVVYWMGVHSLVLLDPNETPPVMCTSCTLSTPTHVTIAMLLLVHTLLTKISER